VTIPSVGHTETNVWYRFYLRVIDADGVADTVYTEIRPVTVTLTLATPRPGLQLTLDGQPRTTPFATPAVAGIIRELGVISPQSVGDTVYAFAAWSDGGDSSHTITTPAVNTTYSATFSATGPANLPPTVSLTAPAAGSDHLINQPVAMTATAGDSGGTVVRVTFHDGATLITTDSTAPYAASWTPTSGGTHQLTARAIDDDGAEVTSAAVSVTVSSPVSDVTPPTVQLTAPANLDRGLTGTITIMATASDNVGVTGVELQVDGVTLLDASSAPYEVTVNSGSYASGVHVVRSRARDAAGNRSAWSTATVTFGGTVELPAGFSQSTLSGGLTGPATAMSFLPDGRLLVAQQNGALRVYRDGSLLSTPMLSVSTTANGERGLLGVTPHPQFSSNRWIYVYYTTTSGGIHNRIARYRVATTGDTVEAGETIFADLPALDDPQVHNGGALSFGPDGKLYVAVGERGNPSDAPRIQSAFGKILRYNDDGTIPGDNPFVGTGGAYPAIWAKGLRNPFTFSFSTTGRMLINDVGQDNWEEINEGIAGADYGWPSREGPGSGGGFTYPVYAYGHSNDPGINPTLVSGVAIVGATFYEPGVNLFGAPYTGSYFFADFEAGWINRLDPSEAGGVYAFAQLGRSIVDLKTGPDGALYVLAYTGPGWGVIRVTR
jgi:glucose/arabinose dehydrogenase